MIKTIFTQLLKAAFDEICNINIDKAVKATGHKTVHTRKIITVI